MMSRVALDVLKSALKDDCYDVDEHKSIIVAVDEGWTCQ